MNWKNKPLLHKIMFAISADFSCSYLYCVLRIRVFSYVRDDGQESVLGYTYDKSQHFAGSFLLKYYVRN